MLVGQCIAVVRGGDKVPRQNEGGDGRCCGGHSASVRIELRATGPREIGRPEITGLDVIETSEPLAVLHLHPTTHGVVTRHGFFERVQEAFCVNRGDGEHQRADADRAPINSPEFHPSLPDQKMMLLLLFVPWCNAFSAAMVQTGAVTLIQRFGSALNLNIHFHILFLDGVCRPTESGPSFRRVKGPTPAALDLLVHTLSDRIARHLEQRGLLVRDTEHEFLKRVFKIEIETCATCGGQMNVIAALEDPAELKRILAPLDDSQDAGPHPEHPPRAPPQLVLPGLME